MQSAEAGLHPDHAAEQVGGSDPGLAEEVEVASRRRGRGLPGPGRWRHWPAGRRMRGQTGRRPGWRFPGFQGWRRRTGRRWAAGEWRAGAGQARRRRGDARFRAPRRPRREPERGEATQQGVLAPSEAPRPRQTTASSRKKVWMRNSTPIQRPSGIDHPRMQLIVEGQAYGAGYSTFVSGTERNWGQVGEVCAIQPMRPTAGRVGVARNPGAVRNELAGARSRMLLGDAHHRGIISLAHAARLPRGWRPGLPATGCARRCSMCWLRALRARRFWICMPGRERWASRR